MDWKVGDVVQLAANSGLAIIARIDADQVLCRWFDGLAVQEQAFRPAALARATQPFTGEDWRRPVEQRPSSPCAYSIMGQSA